KGLTGAGFVWPGETLTLSAVAAGSARDQRVALSDGPSGGAGERLAAGTESAGEGADDPDQPARHKVYRRHDRRAEGRIPQTEERYRPAYQWAPRVEAGSRTLAEHSGCGRGLFCTAAVRPA